MAVSLVAEVFTAGNRTDRHAICSSLMINGLPYYIMISCLLYFQDQNSYSSC